MAVIFSVDPVYHMVLGNPQIGTVQEFMSYTNVQCMEINLLESTKTLFSPWYTVIIPKPAKIAICITIMRA